MKSTIGIAASLLSTIVFTFIACLPDTIQSAQGVLMALAGISAAAFVVAVNLATMNIERIYKAVEQTSVEEIRRVA